MNAHVSMAANQTTMPLPPITPQWLGQVAYEPTLEAMRHFTQTREVHTPDAVWVLEHPAVYTRGLAADLAHGPHPEANAQHTRIPVIQVERGGQITYHGPGQVVVYPLIDLTRRAIKVRAFVHLLEQAVIDLLDQFSVSAQRRLGAPGVYVNAAKIAALGLRVRRGCTLHGVSLNVDMDLSPFSSIHPCGVVGLAVTQTRALGIQANAQTLGMALAHHIIEALEQSHA